MSVDKQQSQEAKVSRETIEAFHLRLNALDVLPERSLRRNSGTYPLVCYVNAITGLVLSKNFDPIPLFIARAVEHMNERPPSESEQPYYELVRRYISHMAYHIRQYTDGVAFPEGRIPPSVLVAGPQEP